MMGREGENDFAIMSLVQDPLASLVHRLAENVAVLQAIGKQLQTIKPNEEDSSSPRICEDLSVGVIEGPDASYGLDESMIDNALVSKSTAEVLQCNDYSEMVSRKSELLAVQAGLRTSIKEEHESRQSDQQRASARRHDIEPLTIQLLCDLAHQSPERGWDEKPKSKKRKKMKKKIR